MPTKDSLTSSPYVRLPLILIGISLSLLLLYLGKVLFIPLLFAFFTAIFIAPLNKFFEKIFHSKTLSAILSVALFVCIISIIFYLLGMEIGQFSKALPMLKERLGKILQHFQSSLQKESHINAATQMDYLKKSANALFSSIGSTFADFFEIVIMIVLFIFFTFYILSYRLLLMQFVLSFFNDSQKKKVFETTVQLRSMINSYVKGLIVEMLIVFTLAFITLLILGIKYALLMATFAALFNLVPYLGIYTATIINILIAIATGTATQSIEVTILFIAIHLIDSNIVLPKIVGSQVKMNPFITLVALIIGELLWGVPGMFLFIPLSAIFRIISEKIDNLKPWYILMGEEKKRINKSL